MMMRFSVICFLMVWASASFAQDSKEDVCIIKIENGKIVRYGNCEVEEGEPQIIKDIRQRVAERKRAQEFADNCKGLAYNYKCYRAIVSRNQDIILSKATSLCKTRYNGKPSNIYDIEHYRLMMNYLKSQIPNGMTSIYIWTGLKYKNGQIRLSSGVPVSLPGVWWSGGTFSGSNFDSIATVVNVHPEGKGQGIMNVTPMYLRHGVICEL